MTTITGVFLKLGDAQEAAVRIKRDLSVQMERINVLAPGASESELASVATTDAEQPGVGKAFGGLLGGALAAAGGMELGVAVASLMMPGVGPVLAIGAAAAALAGAGGVAGGAALGKHMDESVTRGLPTDELYLYKDALRKGRSILIVQSDDEEQATKVRSLLSSAGAESLDAARESWWVGLRDATEVKYMDDEEFNIYRRGFEAAHHSEVFGNSFDDALPHLLKHYPGELCNKPAFRMGYNRGREQGQGK